MLTVAIDPGIHKCGVAVFDRGGKELLWAGTVKRPRSACHLRPSGARAWVEMASCVKRELDRRFNIEKNSFDLGVEEMQMDSRTRGRSIHDTMQVQGVVGAVSDRLSRMPRCAALRSLTPTTWKGNMPKTVMTNRLKAVLTPAERAVIDDRATHDAWDAIGIGTYMLRGAL